MASEEKKNDVLESMEIFHDAQEQAYDMALTEEIGATISGLLVNLEKCMSIILLIKALS